MDKHRQKARALVEQFLAEGREDVVTCGFGIRTTPQGVIEDNLRDMFSEHSDALSWVEDGLVTTDGELIEEGWDVLNRDLVTLERNTLHWLRQTFEDARDEGHSGDELVGTLWIDPEDGQQVEVMEDGEMIGEAEIVIRIPEDVARYEPFFKGVSGLGSALLDIQLTFFNVPEEITDEL